MSIDNSKLANVSRKELEQEYTNVCWFMAMILKTMPEMKFTIPTSVTTEVDEHFRLWYGTENDAYVIELKPHEEI